MPFADIECEERELEELAYGERLLIDIDASRCSAVRAALERHNWRLREAARELGTNRQGLVRLMRELEID